MLAELQHFALIVEHRTFTEAARRAHLSQPALTASIRRLEREMGARLFDRGQRGATLTAAGHALLPHARAALSAVEDGRRAVVELEGLGAGEVRIGASATACTYHLPAHVSRFHARYPRIRLLLREVTPDEALEGLARGGFDLAVVTAPGGERFVDDELILIAREPTDPDHAPFVTFREGATSRAMLDAAFPGATIAMELGSIAAIKSHVAAGIGIALISRSAVAADIASGRFVKIPHPATPIPRTLSLLHRGVDRLAPAAAAFRRQLLDRTDS